MNFTLGVGFAGFGLTPTGAGFAVLGSGRRYSGLGVPIERGDDRAIADFNLSIAVLLQRL